MSIEINHHSQSKAEFQRGQIILHGGQLISDFIKNVLLANVQTPEIHGNPNTQPTLKH